MAHQTRATTRAASTAAHVTSKRQTSTSGHDTSPPAPKRHRARAIATANDAVSTGEPAHEKQTTKRSEPHSPEKDRKLSDKKWSDWSRHADASPYPDSHQPTTRQCYVAHDILETMHGDKVRENFGETDGPAEDMKYPLAMDALVVAALSQATSWSNAKRAMNSMKLVYGSTFAYDAIVEGGVDKLRDALRPGGMQNRKAKILMGLLRDVKARHGKWDLQHLFSKTDGEVVREVVAYWGIGPKCAHCLLSICLRRNRFAVDTHIYRIAGLWGWRPKDATVEQAQAHLDARVPDDVKFMLHYQLIVHGRECPACRGNGSGKLATACEFWKRYKAALEGESE